nr:DegT/DnrJ/EryC1/StrS family aminotransferase [Microvirga solisilvae]
MIPLSRPNIPDEAHQRVSDVLRSGMLVHGKNGADFEQALSAYLGCQDVVVVSSGTAALHLALLALDVGKGDAVLVPDFTFPATANAVLMTGAEPVLVDVEPVHFNISPEALEKAIRSYKGDAKLKAIMPVHEFGSPANLAALRDLAARYDLHIIEDAACALGASNEGALIGGPSTLLSCFSFHPRKTLTTGEGGAVSTNDAQLASRLRRLRNHGMERGPDGFTFVEASTNYRLTDFQSALGLSQLSSLDQWIETRRKIAERYIGRLKPLSEELGVQLPAQAPGHSWQTFMLVLPDRFERDAVVKAMRSEGVEVNLGAQCLSAIGLYGEATLLGNVSVARRLYHQGLAIPMFENLRADEIETVCATLETVLRNAAARG